MGVREEGEGCTYGCEGGGREEGVLMGVREKEEGVLMGVREEGGGGVYLWV